jgi:hypothetical protein
MTGRATPKWLVRQRVCKCGAGTPDATPPENSRSTSTVGAQRSASPKPRTHHGQPTPAPSTCRRPRPASLHRSCRPGGNHIPATHFGNDRSLLNRLHDGTTVLSATPSSTRRRRSQPRAVDQLKIRRGRKYATLLIDAATRRRVDVLPASVWPARLVSPLESKDSFATESYGDRQFGRSVHHHSKLSATGSFYARRHEAPCRRYCLQRKQRHGPPHRHAGGRDHTDRVSDEVEDGQGEPGIRWVTQSDEQ